MLSAVLILISLGNPAPLPPWAQGDWNGVDTMYRRVLTDVEPYYGRDGFIDVDEVGKQWEYHYDQYVGQQGNSIKLMRLLAWTLVAMSDGYNGFFNTQERRMKKQRLVNLLALWQRPVNSFTFVRTFAMVQFICTSPDAYLESRLMEKLYYHDRSDTELELFYAVWCAFNQEVIPSELNYLEILERQEKVEFRNKARKFEIATCYSFSGYIFESESFLRKAWLLRDQWLASLPKDHAGNTQDLKKKLAESKAFDQKSIKRWKDGG